MRPEFSARHKRQSPGAARQRRYRGRLRSGALLVSVEVTPQVVAALVAAGFLAEAEAEDRAALVGALQKMLSTWAARWR